MTEYKWAPLPGSNPNQPPSTTQEAVVKRGGRPRKYTGEPWDSMDEDTYKKAAKKEHNRESNFARRSKSVPQNYYPMPLDRSNITPMMHMDVPAAQEAYQAYTNAQHLVNVGCDTFVKWASGMAEHTEALRLKYMSIIIPLGLNEIPPEAEPDNLANYKWVERS